MDIINLDSDSDAPSIIEIQVSPKKPPPLIDIEANYDSDLKFNFRLECVESEHVEKMEESKDMDENKEMALLKLISPPHWTLSMMKFYNNDWGGEDDFDVAKLQSKMSQEASMWKISAQDEIGRSSSKKRGVKCWNCNQYGHRFHNCPEPESIETCYMCGQHGHSSGMCPDSKCLNCGERTYEYTSCCYNCQNSRSILCQICHLYGHNSVNCTNIWRKYHLTLPGNTVKIPTQNCYKNQREFWCCNCASRGHLSYRCPYESSSYYSETSPFIESYATMFASEVQNIPVDESQNLGVLLKSDTVSGSNNRTVSVLPPLSYTDNAPQTQKRNLRYFEHTEAEPVIQTSELLLQTEPNNKDLSERNKKSKHKKKQMNKIRKLKQNFKKRENEMFEMFFSYNNQSNRISHCQQRNEQECNQKMLKYSNKNKKSGSIKDRLGPKSQNFKNKLKSKKNQLKLLQGLQKNNNK